MTDNKMATGRMLKKEISDSEKLGKLRGKDKARVLYFMMLPHLDVKGRLKAKPKHIKGRITTELEYSETTIQKCLEQLHDAGLITLYTTDGEQCLEYTRFEDFQTITPDREAKSTISPPAPDSSRPTPENSPLSLSKVKDKKIYMSDFEQAIEIYLGTKRGVDTEYENFLDVCRKKTLDPAVIVKLLKPAVERQIAERKKVSQRNEFVPPWKNLKTWINNKCWEEVRGIEPPSKTTPRCVICGEPATGTKSGKPFCSKTECYHKWLRESEV